MLKIPLKDIKYLLLDMDGTLLDKYFDDYFWEHLVPEKYAEKNNITFGKAKDELLVKYKRHEGTLNWTDIDFWSKELNLDIPALKEQIRHLVEVHPYVEDFLIKLRKHKKKVFLVTNAHYKSIAIKFKKTGIGRYFDSVITSFDLGYPKESTEFWKRAEALLRFDKEKTLFVDDTEAVLKTAKGYGIKYILLKTGANSKGYKKPEGGFPFISNFKELLHKELWR